METKTTTLKGFIDAIGRGSDLDRWLSWPPDVFALTSLLLTRTGAYRYSVDPPEGCEWPTEATWKESLQRAKTHWLRWIAGEAAQKPPFLARQVETIERLWERVTVDRLAALRTVASDDDRFAWELCKAILSLHALSDEACAGFGSPSGITWVRDPSLKVIHCMANVLLARTGSLSSLPRTLLRVLPKRRTPRVGLTLRSLSHHLTFHQTEVRILWRTMPWVNIDENSLNVMVVPLPFEVEARWFQQSPYTTPRNSTERDRYFTFTPPDVAFKPAALINLLQEAQSSAGRVHLVVLPELALTKENFHSLLGHLSDTLESDQIPMVLTGLRGKDASEPVLASNTVALASFFAGKWYTLEQPKHHRWRLDDRQIQQYQLGGVLPSNRMWWEAIRVPPRKLSLLSPNSWLTLCPLICEDLARQEPISELIRGVGPTLLLAILLDGPQLRDRWPGRYASVMADDPGSSVLTVSSLGLAKRSKSSSGASGSREVILWKDQISGWNPVKIDEHCQAVLLSLSAYWDEEFCADGRSDDRSAAVFALRGITQLHGKADGEKIEPVEHAVDEAKFSEPHDLEELTIFTYFVDAAIEADASRIDLLCKWIFEEDFQGSRFRPASELAERCVRSRRVQRESLDFDEFVSWVGSAIKTINPSGPKAWAKAESEGGIDSDLQIDRDPYLKYLEEIVRFATAVLDGLQKPEAVGEVMAGRPLLKHQPERSVPVVDVSNFVEKDCAIRVYSLGSLALLWAVHKRLSYFRRNGLLTQAGARLVTDIEALLKKKHDQPWREALRMVRERKSMEQ